MILAHLAKYRSLLPSFALLLHLTEHVEVGARSWRGVSRAAVERAIAWCEYLEANARRLYHSVTSRGEMAAATLATRLKAGKLSDLFTVRDVRQNHWAGLNEREDIVAALDTLVALGWVRATPVFPGERGGRPTMTYRINPRVPTEGFVIQGAQERGFGGFDAKPVEPGIGPGPEDAGTARQCPAPSR